MKVINEASVIATAHRSVPMTLWVVIQVVIQVRCMFHPKLGDRLVIWLASRSHLPNQATDSMAQINQPSAMHSSKDLTRARSTTFSPLLSSYDNMACKSFKPFKPGNRSNRVYAQPCYTIHNT